MDFLKKLFPQIDLIEVCCIGAIIALVLAGFAYEGHRIAKLKVDLATEKTQRADERAQAASAAASAAIDRLEESSNRIATNQEIDREATRFETARHDDAVSIAAATADRGLRRAFRDVPHAASSAGSSDPGPVAVGDPGASADDLRADVFDEWDSRSRILEAALDQSHARGVACQLEYQGLKKKLDAATIAAAFPGAASAPQ